jgi:hypothetical protein
VYTANVNGKPVPKGGAFPICVSVNERICNYSPLESEEQVRGGGESERKSRAKRGLGPSEGLEVWARAKVWSASDQGERETRPSEGPGRARDQGELSERARERQTQPPPLMHGRQLLRAPTRGSSSLPGTGPRSEGHACASLRGAQQQRPLNRGGPGAPLCTTSPSRPSPPESARRCVVAWRGRVHDSLGGARCPTLGAVPSQSTHTHPRTHTRSPPPPARRRPWSPATP